MGSCSQRCCSRLLAGAIKNQAMHPTDSQALYLLAEAAQQSADYRKAVEAYEAARAMEECAGSSTPAFIMNPMNLHESITNQGW